MCLPPHSTHNMQPIDVRFRFPLKTYYAQAIETWLRHNPGRLTNCQVGMIFGEAYQKAATMSNSINAFKKTDLFPCNRHVFGEEDFRIYDNLENPSPLIDCPDALDNNSGNHFTEANKKNQNASGNVSPVPSCSQDMQKQSRDTEIMVSLFQIAPVPTITQKPNKSTRAGSANLITSSPYKKQIEKSLQRKNVKITTQNKSQGKNKSKKIVKRKILVESSSEDDNDEVYQSSRSSSENNDTECSYCSRLFSEDLHGEKWKKCNVCFKWTHVHCEVKSKKFFCAVCYNL